MNIEKAAKEYWIKGDVKNLGEDGFLYANTEVSVHAKCVQDYEDFKDAIHVIEYSALIAKDQRIAELENDTRKTNAAFVKLARDFEAENKRADAAESRADIVENAMIEIERQNVSLHEKLSALLLEVEKHFQIYGFEKVHYIKEIVEKYKKELVK